MYLYTYTTAWLSAYERYCPAKLQPHDRVGVLDTDDLVLERFTVSELEALIQRCPSLEIKGLKHDGKHITSLYGFGNNNQFLIGEDICFHYEQKTNRGSYCTIEIYCKGTNSVKGCDLKIDTPHVEGCYDWDFNILSALQQPYGYDVEISCSIRSKHRLHEFPNLILAINTTNRTCEFKRFIDSRLASRF